MVKVDPFIAPIPKKILNDPELKPFFEYFVRWAHDTWVKIGGATDPISENSTRESYPWSLDANIPQITPSPTLFDTSTNIRTFNNVTATKNYTALPWDWINAKKKSTITFPEFPADGDEIIVRNGDDFNIGLNANGKKINGSSTGIIRDKYSSIRFKFSLVEDEWFAV